MSGYGLINIAEQQQRAADIQSLDGWQKLQPFLDLLNEAELEWPTKWREFDYLRMAFLSCWKGKFCLYIYSEMW